MGAKRSEKKGAYQGTTGFSKKMVMGNCGRTIHGIARLIKYCEEQSEVSLAKLFKKLGCEGDKRDKVNS